MALFIDKANNSLYFNEEDFEINKDYMVDIVSALRDLDPQRPIYFGLDLPETPIVFIVYFKKLVKETPEIDFRLYLKEQNSFLKDLLKMYKLSSYSIDEFPYPLSIKED
jgi:hypothetical protein